MEDLEKLQFLKFQIKDLEQKRTSLTDADQIKAINKQINAFQEELGKLREILKHERAFLKDVEREFIHCEIGGD
ncbi:MAG: hypothetical protein IKU00_08235 [Bacteroidales bacterium]|nr:hypothetical protein [Bacteroidales bacterium]